MSALLESSAPGVRRVGILKAALGCVGVVAVIVLPWITDLDGFFKSHGTLEQLPLVGALCFPFIMLGIGLIELITGKSFRQVEAAWGMLRQWQHIGAFLIVVLVTCALVMLLLWIYGDPWK